MSYGTNTDGGPTGVLEMRGNDSTGRIEVVRRNNNAGVTDSVSSVGAGWVHFFATGDGSTIRLYKNGIEIGSSATAHNFAGTVPFRFGRRSNDEGGTYHFDGKLDDMRVYDTKLTAAQVLSIYNSSKQTKVNSSQNSKLTDGLVGLWSFDGSDIDWTNNRAIDRSGNGNDGVITNMSQTTAPTFGVNGQALQFDGTEYITAPLNLNNYPSVTISAWIYTDTLSFVSAGRGEVIGNNAGSWGRTIVVYPNSYTLFKNSGLGASYSTTPATGRWVHVVGQWSTAETRIYIDGQSVAVGDPETGGYTNGTSIGIGRSPSNTGYYNGRVDEVRVYDRILTGTEISKLYNLGH